MDIVWDNRELLWQGLKYTFRLFAVVLVFGTAVGTVFGIGLLYGSVVVRGVIRAYVDILRGMPLIVTIFLIFYGLSAYEINFSPFQSIALALSIFAAAHMAEIVRGAVGSIPAGQTDAAKALGLTFWPRIRWVILPQAAPTMMGPWTNLAVDIFKSTSLAILVSQADFLFSIQKRAIAEREYLAFYVAAMVVYFVCCMAISQAGRWATRRMRVGMAS